MARKYRIEAARNYIELNAAFCFTPGSFWELNFLLLNYLEGAGCLIGYPFQKIDAGR